MSIKLQMLGGAGRRAASFPRAPRAPFFLRHGLNLRLNLFLLPHRGGKSRCPPGRSVPSVPGRGGPDQEGGLASLSQGGTTESLEIPQSSWRRNPGATLNKPLPAPLRPGSLPPAAGARGLEGDRSRGPASGCAEGARSGGITNIHLAPTLGRVVYGQRLILSTTL